jgi:hypothetical protein
MVRSPPTDGATLVATMIATCDEFEACRYRRVGFELRHRGRRRISLRSHGLLYALFNASSRREHTVSGRLAVKVLLHY